MEYREETIAAIATPIGVGGIGIIRISGYNAEHIVRSVFQSKRPIESFEAFRLYLGHIVDPESHLPVDEVLVSVMHAPFSYTREDVVEINSHSGYAVLSAILQIILQQGARLARPGEFTLRAFLNGRIDLTQAEAIADLVHAKGDLSLTLAARQLAGGFKRRIEEIRQAIIEGLAQVDASLDFPEEESGLLDKSRLENLVRRRALGPIAELIRAHDQRKIWHEGVTVVIVGRVNAGKSSIFNRLLDEERAIVTPIPGTTRDMLDCTISIEGLPVKLIDTAGTRKVKGKIEKMGVDLTRTQLATSDIALVVVDQSRPLNQYDSDLLHQVNQKTAIVVINKIDLRPKASRKKIGCLCKHLTTVEVSALTGEGLPKLASAILKKITSAAGTLAPAPVVPNIRHRALLTKGLGFLKSAAANLRNGSPLELVATDLSWAKDAIDEITGTKTSEEILDTIFSNFCVGK